MMNFRASEICSSQGSKIDTFVEFLCLLASECPMKIWFRSFLCRSKKGELRDYTGTVSLALAIAKLYNTTENFSINVLDVILPLRELEHSCR